MDTNKPNVHIFWAASKDRSVWKECTHMGKAKTKAYAVDIPKDSDPN